MPSSPPHHDAGHGSRADAVPPAKAGDRVQLLHCGDPYTELRPGTLGTVTSVDSRNTTHVRWDDGHQLGLVPGEDAFIVIASAADTPS